MRAREISDRALFLRAAARVVSSGAVVLVFRLPGPARLRCRRPPAEQLRSVRFEGPQRPWDVAMEGRLEHVARQLVLRAAGFAHSNATDDKSEKVVDFASEQAAAAGAGNPRRASGDGRL